MVLLETPFCEFGKKFKQFNLSSTDEKNLSSVDLYGKNGTLIMFICNHCPYVKAIIKEIVATANILKKYNINSLAIMSNDVKKYPEDNFENMKIFSKKHSFTFPYLFDYKQSVAKNYDAKCTPDFFGFNKFNELQYRGRISELKNLKPVADSKNELLEAMLLILKTNKGPIKQFPSMGCSIKWK